MNLTRAVAQRPLRQLIVQMILCGSAVTPVLLATQRAPDVNVWFDQGNEFARGQRGRMVFTDDAGSYVTVLRVDTGGRLTVLSRRQPNDRPRFVGSPLGSAHHSRPIQLWESDMCSPWRRGHGSTSEAIANPGTVGIWEG